MLSPRGCCLLLPISKPGRGRLFPSGLSLESHQGPLVSVVSDVRRFHRSCSGPRSGMALAHPFRSVGSLSVLLHHFPHKMGVAQATAWAGWLESRSLQHFRAVGPLYPKRFPYPHLLPQDQQNLSDLALEKILLLGKIEGRRRRGWQRKIGRAHV